jgi:hypothetical protein
VARTAHTVGIREDADPFEAALASADVASTDPHERTP